MIVRFQDFKVEARIPSLQSSVDLASPNNTAVQARVQEYIDKYEPMFAEGFFLCAADYDTFKGLAEEEESSLTEDEKKQLKMLRFSLSHYVAFHYFSSQTNMMIGAVVLESENGQRSSLESTLTVLWNQMVENNVKLFSMLYEYCFDRRNELFVPVNKFNI